MTQSPSTFDSPRYSSRANANALLLAACLSLLPVCVSAGELTVYRCVGANNHISLQDHPCPKDTHQDVRQMLRPQDPPMRRAPAATANAIAQSPVITREIRIVHVREPRPLYECRTFDGKAYLSRTGIPERRLVPLWVLDYGTTFGNTFVGTSGGYREGYRDRGASLERGQLGGRQQAVGNLAAFAPGVWVEDDCQQLPQDEVCQRVRDRQDRLGTLIFNAQPSDRAIYERERRSLVEQQRTDCGG
ncbi:MAG: hypothetical protein ABIQ97_02190 [Lysobacteraceae bacterium]